MVRVVEGDEFYEVYDGDRLIAKVSKDSKDLLDLISVYDELVKSNDGTYGAMAIFVGIVKEFSDGKRVKYVSVKADVNLKDVVILHREGVLKPREPIVYIGAIAKTRFELFERLKRAVEEVKRSHVIEEFYDYNG